MSLELVACPRSDVTSETGERSEPGATSPIGPEPWLARSKQATLVTLSSDDPAGPHEMRVALARLRVWLQLSGRHGELERDLAWLRRKVAKVRDADVELKQRSGSSSSARVRTPAR